MTRDHPAFTKDDFALADEHMSQDSKMEMLKGVSVLEVCLLLAMRRLTEVYDGQPFNFEMIYKEYVKFATNRAFMSFDKEIALRAFDNLLLVQFVCPAEGCSAQVPKEYRLMNLMIEPAQIMKLVDTYPGLPVEVKQWSASLIA